MSELCIWLQSHSAMPPSLFLWVVIPAVTGMNQQSAFPSVRYDNGIGQLPLIQILPLPKQCLGGFPSTVFTGVASKGQWRNSFSSWIPWQCKILGMPLLKEGMYLEGLMRLGALGYLPPTAPDSSSGVRKTSQGSCISATYLKIRIIQFLWL